MADFNQEFFMLMNEHWARVIRAMQTNAEERRSIAEFNGHLAAANVARHYTNEHSIVTFVCRRRESEEAAARRPRVALDA